MLQAQTAQAEEMLWSLMPDHQERGALARRVAQQERQQSRDALAGHLLQRARSYDEDAEAVRGLLRAHMAVVASGEDKKDME